jgi:hypothetical protein
VIHWGDPAFDVGFALTHLLSKAHHLGERRADFGAAAELFWRTYRAATAAFAQEPGFEARAVRHTLGCLLARVAGRSPLEYLDAAARQRQCGAVLELFPNLPTAVPNLITRFLTCLSSCESAPARFSTVAGVPP